MPTLRFPLEEIPYTPRICEKAPACLHRVRDGNMQRKHTLVLFLGQILRRRLTSVALWLVGPGRLHYDAFECVSLCLHSHMEVIPENLLVDVADNLPDRLLPSPAFSELCDQRMAMVVPPACHLRTCADVLPRGLDRGHVPRGIPRSRSPKRKDKPLRTNLMEFLPIPRHVLDDGLLEHRVDWNRPPLSRSRFALSYLDKVLVQMNLAPGERLDLGVAHSSVKRHREREMNMGRTRIPRQLPHPLGLIRFIRRA